MDFDHLPLTVGVMAEGAEDSEEGQLKKEVINWNKDAAERYKEGTRRRLYKQDEEATEDWEKLKNRDKRDDGININKGKEMEDRTQKMAKAEKQIWSYINKERKRRTSAVNKITIETMLRILKCYLVLEESKREKLRVKAGIRAWKFEEGVRKDVGRKIVKECLKEKEANREQTRTGKEREEYLKRNGLSQAGVDELRREGREVTERIRRRDKEVQQQRQYTKIEQSKYNIRYKYIRTIGLPEYLSKEERGQKLIAQARCGNLENWNKYWEEEEGRKEMRFVW
ncbi:hypothetical protein WH47_10928 [Habropoda laboriosa]|uniref:Uncharacterized protein n=1 Tax=Habropoda laboriosa TaxID=597456 RepID=A0A0L7QKF9_9HYME|nr:hypothetical protein WH47_10928 [Habropoda laboriosa]